MRFRRVFGGRPSHGAVSFFLKAKAPQHTHTLVRVYKPNSRFGATDAPTLLAGPFPFL